MEQYSRMPEFIRIGPIELRFLKSKHETAGSLDMFEMSCQPKARMPVPHYHRDWDESVYGLEGVTTFTIDGKAVDIGPGDNVFIPRGAVHGFDIRGAAVARCLCVLTPGLLGPEYFREVAALATSGPPDPAKMREVMSRHGLVPVAG
jgi:quercetin dioxygenase-like cupin family protein